MSARHRGARARATRPRRDWRTDRLLATWRPFPFGTVRNEILARPRAIVASAEAPTGPGAPRYGAAGPHPVPQTYSREYHWMCRFRSFGRGTPGRSSEQSSRRHRVLRLRARRAVRNRPDRAAADLRGDRRAEEARVGRDRAQCRGHRRAFRQYLLLRRARHAGTREREAPNGDPSIDRLPGPHRR